MPIGNANGNITLQDVNIEYGLSPTATIGLNDVCNSYGVNTTGTPYPSDVGPTNLSGYSHDDGFYGYTNATVAYDGTSSYVGSNTSLPSELQFTYTTPFTFSFWIYNDGGTNPISAGYQPNLLYLGTTTFGQRTLQLYYEGKLTNGAYSNKIIARLVRSSYASGRRDYKWDLNSNGIITNGNGWNSANNAGWHHLVLTYNGGGTSTGAFQLYWNGTLLTVNQTNNLTDSSNTWTYNGTERVYLGARGYSTSTGHNAWQFSGFCFYDYVISAANVTTLYYGGAGVGCRAITDECHWWGLSGNPNDRADSFTSGGPSWSNYNLTEFNSPEYSKSRPSK